MHTGQLFKAVVKKHRKLRLEGVNARGRAEGGWIYGAIAPPSEQIIKERFDPRQSLGIGGDMEGKSHFHTVKRNKRCALDSVASKSYNCKCKLPVPIKTPIARLDANLKALVTRKPREMFLGCNFCPHGSFLDTVRTNLTPTRRIRHRGQKELVVGEELEGITIRYTQAKSRTSKKFEGVARNKSIFGACDTRHEKRLTPVFKVSAGNSRVKIIQLQVSAQNALKCSGHSEAPGNVPWAVINPFRAQNGGVAFVMARVNGVLPHMLFQPSPAPYCIQASRLAWKNIEHQSPKLCSAWDRELKREQQKAKKWERMARYRARLKDMPAEEREEVYERARMARARYRANHRLELRLQARSLRASQYEATYGTEAYEAKLERKRLKKLEDEGRRRRAVRPRVPESPKKGRRPQPELAASLLDGNSGKGGA
ncbi:hypothetical protein B0H14DRAFT_2652935 [Mycena olivaceomarginata]|nr:hypothetical protein B0H14DRAFT_2652935 [Mycena olivaceomarginata]